MWVEGWELSSLASLKVVMDTVNLEGWWGG